MVNGVESAMDWVGMAAAVGIDGEVWASSSS